MFPLTFPIGNVSIYAGDVLLIFSWLTYSFLFWRGLRRWGIDEDRIFDLTFYATLMAFITARLWFVVTHWNIFAGKSFLLMIALWISPGLSWMGAVVGGMATTVMLSRQYKVRLGLVLDTLATTLPLPIIIGEVASLFYAVEVGKPTPLVWGIRYAGHAGIRHPVQLYEIFVLSLISYFMIKISTVATRKKWAYGLVGVWFFVLYSIASFLLEFAKDSTVYWGRLTANQWILIGIFAECVGVLYVRGGRETFRPITRAVRTFISEKGKTLYAAIPKRHAH